MKSTSEDSQIQDMLRRVKRDDERTVPSFEDVLSRPLPELQRPRYGVRWTIACGTAATLLVAFFAIRSQFVDSAKKSDSSIADSAEPPPPIVSQHPDTARDSQAVAIDFDRARQSVDDYFVQTQSHSHMEVWSSRTESLLTLNLNNSSLQE